jgi:raffinose/stachyose/melibiose transport system permease protein
VPALVFFLVFAVVPLAGVVFLSFTSWDGLREIRLDGLSSWATVLSDPVTGNALLVTAKIMFFSFIVQAPISLLLGVFTAGGQKYRAALAVLYFLPLLLSSAAVAIAFKALLDPNFGLGPGLQVPFLIQDWLGNSDLVLFVVVFVIAWQFVPFHTLIY